MDYPFSGGEDLFRTTNSKCRIYTYTWATLSWPQVSNLCVLSLTRCGESWFMRSLTKYPTVVQQLFKRFDLIPAEIPWFRLQKAAWRSASLVWFQTQELITSLLQKTNPHHGSLRAATRGQEWTRASYFLDIRWLCRNPHGTDRTMLSLLQLTLGCMIYPQISCQEGDSSGEGKGSELHLLHLKKNTYIHQKHKYIKDVQSFCPYLQLLESRVQWPVSVSTGEKRQIIWKHDNYQRTVTSCVFSVFFYY